MRPIYAGALVAALALRSNTAIARQLVVTDKTVEAHIRSIFGKLGLDEATDANRRVLAVLTYLRAAPRD